MLSFYKYQYQFGIRWRGTSLLTFSRKNRSSRFGYELCRNYETKRWQFFSVWWGDPHAHQWWALTIHLYNVRSIHQERKALQKKREEERTA